MSVLSSIAAFFSASQWPKTSGSVLPSGSSPYNYFRASDTWALTASLNAIADFIDSGTFAVLTGTTVTGSDAKFTTVTGSTGVFADLSGGDTIHFQDTGTLVANVANNSGSVAHIIDTAQALDTGSKILSVRNAGVEFFSVRADGNIGVNFFVTGSTTYTGTVFADGFSGRTGTLDLSAFGGTMVRIDENGWLSASVTGAEANVGYLSSSIADSDYSWAWTSEAQTLNVLGNIETVALTATHLAQSGSVSGLAASPMTTVAAAYGMAGSQTYTKNVLTIARFDNVEYDTHSAVTTGTNWRFTLPTGQAGIYNVHAGISIIASSGTITRVEISFYKNSGSYTAAVNDLPPILGTVTYNASMAVRLTGTDYIDVRVKCSDPTNNIQNRAGADSNWIHIVRVPGS